MSVVGARAGISRGDGGGIFSSFLNSLPAKRTTAPALGLLTRCMIDTTSRWSYVSSTWIPSSSRSMGSAVGSGIVCCSPDTRLKGDGESD